MYTDFNHFYCYNEKYMMHKIKMIKMKCTFMEVIAKLKPGFRFSGTPCRYCQTEQKQFISLTSDHCPSCVLHSIIMALVPTAS